MAVRKMTAKEYKEKLLGIVASKIEEGLSPQDAMACLTEKQFDWLVDHDVDTDQFMLTAEQRKTILADKKKAVGRRLSPEGYNKKYPLEKQRLYESIVELLKSQGADIIPPEKCNFRDLDFVLGSTKYRIVLSCPKK